MKSYGMDEGRLPPSYFVKEPQAARSPLMDLAMSAGAPPTAGRGAPPVQGGSGAPPFQMRQPPPAPQGMPTQEQIDQAWRETPTDQVGAEIEELVNRSGGALQYPWDRMPPR